jgi:hypothetical protein
MVAVAPHRLLPMYGTMSQPNLTEADPFDTSDYQDRRRGEPRILCERDISAVRCAPGERELTPAGRPFKVRLTDCSLNGLGMMLPEAVPAGQQLLVKVEMNRLPMMLLYTVRYCVPMAEDQFRAGLRFSGYVASRFRGEMRTVLTAMTGG